MITQRRVVQLPLTRQGRLLAFTVGFAKRSAHG
jgi:hypothetical protein